MANRDKPLIKGIIQDIIKAIIIAFFCWIGGNFYSKSTSNLSENQENIKMFLMYSTLEYPSQLLLSCMDNEERLAVAEELIDNFKDTETEYFNKNKLKFRLKPQDKYLLQNKINNVNSAKRNLKILWIGMTIFIVILLRILRKTI